MKKLACVISIALAAAACGDDGGNPGTDGGTDAPIDTSSGGVCGTPVMTLSTYPATYAGTVNGAGSDLSVAKGACAEETGYFGASGEDTVVALTGLTAGNDYIIELGTNEDLSMYLATSCDAAGPLSGACLLHVDRTLGTEAGSFTAPASGALYVIIDTPDDVTPATGAFTLSVNTSECTEDSECTTPGESVCLNQQCVACAGPFDCTVPGAPVCDGATHACVAGPVACTGDDAGEDDDGPAAATPLAFPTLVTPTTATAAVCSTPAAERDWYSITTTGAGAVRVSITWTATADLDFRVLDDEGATVGSGTGTASTNEIALVRLPAAGTYYLVINQFAPAAAAAATPYSLTLGVPECETSFNCPLAGTPLCDAGGTCVAGPATCTGDDVGEPDDGPAAARLLNGAVGVAQTRTGAICNAPGAEFDWYRVDVLQGEGVTVTLEWPTAVDLDVTTFDSQGRTTGLAFWSMPENVTLTYLPVGAHYIRVALIAQNPTPAAVAYSIGATRTVAQVCTSSADCATTHSNQFYRGQCTAGACGFILAGSRADGAACDSFDDCMSQDCSYTLFEADAQDSVCTHSCTSNADCASLGAFTCTTGLQANFCTPSCTSALECGVFNTNSNTLDPGQPWDYATCTTGVCSL